jgi:hypothetical protein
MHLGKYIGIAHLGEKALARALKMVADKHGSEPDIYHTCHLLASWSKSHQKGLKPFIAKYSEEKDKEAERLSQSLFTKPRSGELGMLRDLHDLWLMTQEMNVCWNVILQAARALRDKELEKACMKFDEETKRQSDWLLTRIKQAAPQILVVAQ